jgi:hypothetical protein
VLLNPSIVAKADLIKKFSAENCQLPSCKVFTASNIIQQLTDVAAALSAKITIAEIKRSCICFYFVDNTEFSA